MPGLLPRFGPAFLRFACTGFSCHSAPRTALVGWGDEPVAARGVCGFTDFLNLLFTESAGLCFSFGTLRESGNCDTVLLS